MKALRMRIMCLSPTVCPPATMGAVKQLSAKGEKVGYIRPIACFPSGGCLQEGQQERQGHYYRGDQFCRQMNIDAALCTKNIWATFPFTPSLITTRSKAADHLRRFCRH
jgi:hypothetical protein